MLEANRKLFEERADRAVPGWRKANKNDLINKYIEYEHTDRALADGYMSAILCRYWKAIDKYYATSYRSVSVETCYDWLIRSVLYAIQRRPWVDPNNKLYTDPNGPDKVVNRVIQSTRLGFYQQSNLPKRKVNFGTASLDALVEDLGEAAPLPEIDDFKDLPMEMDIKNFIVDAFKNQEYLLAFMVDGIINYEVFERIKEPSGNVYSQFSLKKLSRHVRSLSPSYCERFSEDYGPAEEDVEKAAKIVRSFSRVKLQRIMNCNMKLLGRTKALALGAKA